MGDRPCARASLSKDAIKRGALARSERQLSRTCRDQESVAGPGANPKEGARPLSTADDLRCLRSPSHDPDRIDQARARTGSHKCPAEQRVAMRFSVMKRTQTRSEDALCETRCRPARWSPARWSPARWSPARATESQPYNTWKNLGRLTLSGDEPPLPTEESFSRATAVYMILSDETRAKT